MELSNNKKCFHITFSKANLNLSLNMYCTYNSYLQTVSFIKDLDVYLRYKFLFQRHISFTASKAIKKVCFIKRCYNLKCPETFKSIYYSLIYLALRIAQFSDHQINLFILSLDMLFLDLPNQRSLLNKTLNLQVLKYYYTRFFSL